MKICFVCLQAYPLLNPTRRTVFGGMEVRAVNFGRGIQRISKHQVHFVVNDNGQPLRQEIEHFIVWVRRSKSTPFRTNSLLRKGLMFVPSFLWENVGRGFFQRAASLPVRLIDWVHRADCHLGRKCTFPFVTWRNLPMALIWNVFHHLRLFPERASVSGCPSVGLVEDALEMAMGTYVQVDADVYCTMGVNEISAEVVLYCKQNGRKSVLLLASDDDLSESYVEGSMERNRYSSMCGLCHYALKNADAIVVQTEKQRSLLSTRFGRDGIQIWNPIDMDIEIATLRERKHVLWIGRADSFHKRADLALEMVKRCPEIPFLFILNKHDPKVYKRINSERPRNLEIQSRVPYDEMYRYFMRAAALVSTSSQDYEGFPNTFLQAGKYRIPVVTLEADPDGILNRTGAGLVADGSMDFLVQHVRRVWQDSRFSEDLASKWHAYVRNTHGLEGRCHELERVLQKLVDTPPTQEPK